MSVRSLKKQLEDVDAAIARVETLGQRMGNRGRSRDLPALDVLYRRRDRLVAAIARAAGARTKRVRLTGVDR